MSKYRKKPVVIEAVQYDGKNFFAIRDFVGDKLEIRQGHKAGWRLFIRTLEGDMEVSVGDYVIKGVQGEFYPCKPDIFVETYELAE
jgi:hypothetical protein